MIACRSRTAGVRRAGLVCLLALVAGLRAADSPARIDGATADDRLAAFRRYVAGMPMTHREPRAVMAPVVARILEGSDTGAAVAKWAEVAAAVRKASTQRLAKNPQDANARNPFEKHALIHAHAICHDRVALPPGLVEDLKGYVGIYRHRNWAGYGALNYRLMNDGAGFIAAETWPDLKDADGLDSAGIREATRQRLFGYFDEIVRFNTDEYAAPTYLGIDLSAMRMLASFARDPEMRRRAALTLDSMFLHVACAWNQGYYVTPASRAKYYWSTITGPDGLDTTGAVGWFFFGAGRPVDPSPMNPAGSVWFCLPGGYRPPDLFAAIANDRSQPATHRGSQRTRVRLIIHHRPGYSVASQCEFVTNPNDGIYKEARRTMFKWVSNHPQSTFAPMQDNPRRPYRLQEKVANAFGYGENPFTQVLQHEGTLLGISSVPSDYPYWRMYAPFPTTGSIGKRVERDGWVFCHGGTVLFAFRYARPARWGAPRPKDHCDVLESDARTNGWVLETCPVGRFAGGGPEAELGRFADAMLVRTRFDAAGLDLSPPRLSFRALDGTLMEARWRSHREAYDGHHRVDGNAVDYAAFPLFGGPWANQALGADILEVRQGPDRLTYDFKAWTRTSGRSGP